jgi:hypothetical protein
MQEKLAVLATKVIRSKKGSRREECLLPFLSHTIVCSEQETGRRSRERGGANRKPEFAYEAVLCVNKKRPAISFYHTYIYTEITKHSILKDTLRDRQTSWATFLSREE